MSVLTHVCPKCGGILVIRRNGRTSIQFFGCSKYPKCDYTTPLTTDVEMRLAGAQNLPGLG